MELSEGLILGVDVAFGSIRAQRQPRYAVIALKSDKVLFEEHSLSYFKLIRLIKKYNPDMVAVDNIYEITPTRRELLNFISKLPYNTKIVQVTGLPKGKWLRFMY